MYNFNTKLFILSLLFSFLLTPSLFSQNLGGVVNMNACGSLSPADGVTVNIQISTADGAVVLTQKSNATGLSAIDFTEFIPGIYYVTVATDTGRLVDRFVKL